MTKKIQFDIMTLFPDMFPGYLNESILGRAQKNKLIKINYHNFRDYTTDKHRTVDDAPYGGGPGMVLKIEPIYKCLKKIRRKHPSTSSGQRKSKVVLLTPQGKTFNQKMARDYAKLDQLIFISGRYEGFDERVRDLVDDQVSVGDYVLTGGELPAMIMIDAIARNIPGVLGKDASIDEESHSEEGVLEYPHYTRPEVFEYKDSKGVKKILKVPDVLKSGDHKKISEWRKNKMVKLSE